MAWEFNERGGKLLTTGAVAWDAESLESLPDGLQLLVFGPRFRPIDEAIIATGFEATNRDALEGAGAWRMGGGLLYSNFFIDPARINLTGRRVSVNVWVQPRGTMLQGRLYYIAGDVAEALQSGGFGGPGYIGSVALKPTGRVTSDGWREISTGPVDWTAGEVDAGLLSIFDGQFDRSSYLLDFNPAHRAGLDALEIVDLGPAAVSGEPCQSVDVEATCGAQGVCVWGRCVDGSIVTDTMPDARIRGDYIDRKIIDFQHLEAGVRSQEILAEELPTLQALKDAEGGAPFWQGLRESVARLQDGHASAPAEDFELLNNAGVCLVMGEADLIDADGPLPLVFGTSAEISGAPLTEFTEQLQAGDALTAIDGVNPYQWLDETPLPPVHAGDPVVRDFVLTPQLVGRAIRAGAELTFQRCVDPDDVGGCASIAETVIDTAELAGDVWGQGAPEWMRRQVPCDYRFERWVDGNNAAEQASYQFVGVGQEEDISVLLINGTPDPSTDENRWGQRVNAALRDSPQKVILDHRQGGGGTVTGVDLVAAYFLDPEEFDVINWFAYFGDDWGPEVYEALLECLTNPSGDSFPVCGSSYLWDPFSRHPDPGGASDARLAVVIGQDVSGNDFLTELLRRREAPTLILGSPATYGAFGTVVGLPGLLGEFAGGSVQISDSIFFDEPYQPGDALPEFTTGVGVPADEVVLQRQSDILNGVDTALERARQWLNEEE